MKAQIHGENFSPWLSQSKLQRIYRTSNQGIKWDMEDIRSEGMLKNASESWKDCQLVLGEMAIEHSKRYCNSLKKWVGNATLPTHDGIATKALVFILAGITKRRKLAVAVYFTNKRTLEVREQKGDNPTGIAYANIFDSIIKAKSFGAYVVKERYAVEKAELVNLKSKDTQLIQEHQSFLVSIRQEVTAHKQGTKNSFDGLFHKMEKKIRKLESRVGESNKQTDVVQHQATQEPAQVARVTLKASPGEQIDIGEGVLICAEYWATAKKAVSKEAWVASIFYGLFKDEAKFYRCRQPGTKDATSYFDVSFVIHLPNTTIEASPSSQFHCATMPPNWPEYCSVFDQLDNSSTAMLVELGKVLSFEDEVTLEPRRSLLPFPGEFRRWLKGTATERQLDSDITSVNKLVTAFNALQLSQSEIVNITRINAVKIKSANAAIRKDLQ
ncbi:hypothetical protein FOCC_FOCC007298 [Frankliniella occidentalis]|nr:hypothetical protein FOCC_FOCC007298 [Frankliniella occidentalis]